MENKEEHNTGPVGYARRAIREVIIPYRPEYTKLTGRVTAAILLQQIVFYWEYKQGPFYKFRAPCGHPLYVEGDSWMECLGFSGAEFDTALKTIGSKVTAGTSKEELLAGTDVTNLVIYWTDSGRVTYYELNVPLFDRLTDPLYSDANSRKSNLLIQESAISKLQNPELPITEIPEIPEKAASPPQKSFSSPPADEQYRVEYYYKDKSAVRTIGTVSNGPWSVECICGGDVVIDSLETGTPCLCGQREFVLSRHKPKAVVKRKHPAVEAYYSIAKSRGVRYGSQDDELEKRIAQTVTDIPFWRQVVVEYIARWSPLNILIMLQYYEESRLPGTRKGEEGGGETTHTELPAYEPDFSDITEEDIAETLASLRDMEECLL